MKKFFKGMIVLFFVLMMITNVQATESEGNTSAIQDLSVFNVGVYDTEYKSSEYKLEKMLPFFNISSQNMVYDTDVDAHGITFGSLSVDVKEKLRGIHVIFAGDTLTIDGSVEFPIVLATNVVINGKVDRDTLIFAESVFVTENAEIANDLTVFGGSLEVRGKVNGNVLGAVDNLCVTGQVGKDIRMQARGLAFENETINGDIYLETDSDTTYLENKYKNVKVYPYTAETVEEKTESIDIEGIITKGIIVAVVCTLIALLITRKETNVVQKMSDKFITYTPYAILMSLGLIVFSFLILMVLLILALVGLGIVAWPIIIFLIAFAIISYMIQVFVVGSVVANLITRKIKSTSTVAKIGIYAGIFILVYTLTKITGWLNMLVWIVSMAILITHMTRRLKEDKVTVITVEEDKNEDVEDKK